MPIVITGSGPTAGFGLVIDPDDVATDIADGTSYRLMSLELPEPKVKAIYAGNFDTEGSVPAAEHGYENREIPIGLRAYGGDPAALLTTLGVLKQAQGKINREQGELEVTFPSGEVIRFDLVEAAGGEQLHSRFLASYRTEGELRFVARPFWRGEEVTFSAVSETSLPVLITTAGGIKGDVPAIGRLVVTDTGGTDRSAMIWGVQSRYYDAAATAALFFQAEALTPKGGAATAVGATGASGSGSNVVRQGTLTPTPQAMLSTQLNGGSHLTHIGSFAVFARLYMPTSNTGAVSVALEWALGDFRRRTLNDAVDFDAGHPREGQFVIARLGQVHIAEGTQQWEGRLLASSTAASDDLDVDWIALVPITEGSGELSGVFQFENPSSFSGRDEFDQSAGALTGKTAPVGGTWAGAGDSDDLTVETTGRTVQRTAVSDATVGGLSDGGRATTLDVNLAAVAVQCDAKSSAGLGDATDHRVVARWSSTSSFCYAGWQQTGEAGVLVHFGAYDAAAQVIARETVGPTYTAGDWYTTRLLVFANGTYYVWVYLQGTSPGEPIFQGQDARLATGGALASGDVGIWDRRNGSSADTRNYDNFMAFVPTADAAIFANQSLELTHQGAEREDSGGTIWSPVSNVEGDYCKLAPAGREGRTNRLIVLPFRNDPDTMGDPGGAANLTVQPSATPRGVSIPTP